jgi:hypothetical protein
VTISEDCGCWGGGVGGNGEEGFGGLEEGVERDGGRVGDGATDEMILNSSLLRIAEHENPFSSSSSSKSSTSKTDSLVASILDILESSRKGSLGSRCISDVNDAVFDFTCTLDGSVGLSKTGCLGFDNSS